MKKSGFEIENLLSIIDAEIEKAVFQVTACYDRDLLIKAQGLIKEAKWNIINHKENAKKYGWKE